MLNPTFPVCSAAYWVIYFGKMNDIHSVDFHDTHLGLPMCRFSKTECLILYII